MLFRSGTTVTSVAVNSNAATLEKGKTMQFSATVYGANSPAQTVTWSVNSALSSINSSGVLTVPAGETKTSLTVTATSTVNTTVSGTKTITVEEANNNLGGGGINFDYEAMDVNIGKKFWADGYEWVVIGADTTNGNRELLITTTGIVGKVDYGVNNAYGVSMLALELREMAKGFTQLNKYIQPVIAEPASGNLTAVDNTPNTARLMDGGGAAFDMLKHSKKSVFALSEAEINKYFADSRVSQYKSASGEGTTWYWTRTTGSTGSYVKIMPASGTIGETTVGKDGGVRPAMWINLGTDILTSTYRDTNKIFKADGIYWRVVHFDTTTKDMLITSREAMGGTMRFNPSSQAGMNYAPSDLKTEMEKYNNTNKLPTLYSLMQKVQVPVETVFADVNATHAKTYVDRELGTKTAFAFSISDINVYFTTGIEGKVPLGTTSYTWLRSPWGTIGTNSYACAVLTTAGAFAAGSIHNISACPRPAMFINLGQ